MTVLGDILADSKGKQVTVETRNGSRYCGIDFEVREDRRRGVFALAITVANGRTVIPWHSVALVHVHDEEDS